MATGDITRGTRTVLANVARLHSNTNGLAEAFGEIDVTGGGVAVSIYLIVPIHSSATAGTYDLYIVESQDAAEWTDNIDPATSGDVAAKIADARLVASVNTIYDATHRTDAEFHVSINMFEFAAGYLGLCLDNNSGQTIPASGADGDSVILTVS